MDDDRGGVTQETIDRLVHRAGIKDSDVRCDPGWEVRMNIWTDTYDGILDTMTFDGVVDTVPIGDEFYGISLIERLGIAVGLEVVQSGHQRGAEQARTVPRRSWPFCRTACSRCPPMPDFKTALAGISTAQFTVDATVDTSRP